MSTQYKRIQNKLKPKEKEQEKGSKMKPKSSRDALLLLLIAVSVLVLFVGWPTMDTVGKSMYGAMIIGMIVVYANRQLDMGDKSRKILIGVSSAMLMLSIGLLGYSVYVQFIK